MLTRKSNSFLLHDSRGLVTVVHFLLHFLAFPHIIILLVDDATVMIVHSASL